MNVQELEFQQGEITDALSSEEARELLGQLSGWALENNGKVLARSYKFSDFVGALRFANAVGELAEEYNHHPEVTLEYGKATVKWWTHTAGGVTANDFLLARETDGRADH